MPPYNESSRLLADRLAILLVICKSRTGSWNPFFLDRFYEGAAAEEIRDWPDYKTAKQIVANMLRRERSRRGNGQATEKQALDEITRRTETSDV